MEKSAGLFGSAGSRLIGPGSVPPMLTVERSAIGKASLAWGGEPLLAYRPGDEIPSSVVRRTWNVGSNGNARTAWP